MTEQNLHISSIVKKHSEKTGNDYWPVETNQGKMTVWDEVIAEEIEKAGVPNDFNVNVETKGNWKNITSITMSEDGQSTAKVTESIPKASQILSEDEKRFCGMAISYAKDLAVGKIILVGNIRKEAMGFLDLYREMTGVVRNEKTT